MRSRQLGRSQIHVNPLGLGCFAIGGTTLVEGTRKGWLEVYDDVSKRALHCALEMGVNFFDTADVYGAGRSERLIGEVIDAIDRRDVVIATKFGKLYNEATASRSNETRSDSSYIRWACQQSLRRLQTDYIDLYLFHVESAEADDISRVRDVLEDLVNEGMVRWYGWSTNRTSNVRVFAEGPHFTAVEQTLNMFEGCEELLAICEELDLVSICRSPLAKGFLTGKYSSASRFPKEDSRYAWHLSDANWMKRADHLPTLRHALAQDGRSLTQAAIGWIWARSNVTLPIPGFRTVEQVEENAGAVNFGPLSPALMAAIDNHVAKVG